MFIAAAAVGARCVFDQPGRVGGGGRGAGGPWAVRIGQEVGRGVL